MARAPQSAGDTVVAFDFISPSGLGTIPKSGGWLDVRAHSHMVMIATPSTTGCSFRVEILRTTADPVVGVLVADTPVAAGVTSEIYNGSLDGVALMRVITNTGTAPNTAAASFLIS